MSDISNEPQDVQAAKDEAAQAVVERVGSNLPGAEPQTVKEELDKGFDEAGVDVPEGDLADLAEQIHGDGEADASSVDAS